MKKPIAQCEIKRGDLIRLERENDWAREYRANDDEHTNGWGHYYLLDRPKPAVELPIDGERALGWITDDHDTVFGDFQWRRVHVEDGPVGQIVRRDILAWTPATAVPTAALDELREDVSHWCRLDPTSTVGKFLLAIDEATR